MLKKVTGAVYGLTRSQFARNLGRYSLSATSGQVMMMIYILVVARALGPGAFGIYSGTYALTSLTIFWVSWGMDTWLLREPGSLAHPRAWAGRVLRIKAWLGAGWGLLLVVIAPLIKPDIFPRELVLICAVDMWADGALTTHITALNIQKRFKAVSNLVFFSRLGRLIGALGVAVWAVSPVAFGLARCAATLGGLLAAAWALKPDWHGEGTPTDRQVLGMTVEYGVSELLTLIYMQADVTILNLLTDSRTTGLYAPASSLINALFVIPATAYNMVIPNLARKLTAGREQFTHSAVRVMVGFTGFGVVFALGVGLWGGWVLRWLLGSAYDTSSVLLTMLSPLLLFRCATYGFASVILAVGWQRQRLLAQVVSALFNVLANIWLIPQAGVAGVAAVYVASELILTVGYAGLVLKWHRQHKPIEPEGS